MVHLICLHCNRPNASEAKFCIECGAGLLRKFCKSCRAPNDSEAHFCQACGAALRSASEPAAAPATKTTHSASVPDFVPSLTDVVTLGPQNLEPAPDLPLAIAARADVAPVDPSWLAHEPTPARAAPRQVPFQAVALVAVGTAVAIPVALWFWFAAETGTPRSYASPAPRVGPAMPALMQSNTAPDHSGDAATAATETATKLLQAYPDASAGAGAPGAPARGQRDGQEPAKPALKRAGPDATTAAFRPPARAAAGADGAAAARQPKAVPAAPPPTPAEPRECTPNMIVLALCASPTNTNGR